MSRLSQRTGIFPACYGLNLKFSPPPHNLAKPLAWGPLWDTEEPNYDIMAYLMPQSSQFLFPVDNLTI